MPSRAEADVAAAQAALAQAQWKLDQKTLAVPSDALCSTRVRPGEFIAAGQPVVSLLPAANIKARFFVPATIVPQLRMGAAVKIEANRRRSPYCRARHLCIAASRILAA